MPPTPRSPLLACGTLVLLAAAVAGCSGAPAHRPPGAGDGPGFEDFDVPEGSLAIRGVVVSQAIVPLKGVIVQLDGGRNATSTPNGTFAFADVDAGVHVLTTHRLGLLPATTTVSVRTPDDPLVRIVLQVDNETVPYHQVQKVSMLLQCGVGLPGGVSYSTCQTPNGASDIVCSTAGVCLGHPLEHNGLVEVDPGSVAPDFAQAEAIWDATNPSSQSLTWTSAARGRGTLDFDNSTDFVGPSPVIMPWNKTSLADAAIGPDREFVFEVFPASGNLSLVLQQRVDLFVTTFYNDQPAQGWTFAADGEPVDPR